MVTSPVIKYCSRVVGQRCKIRKKINNQRKEKMAIVVVLMIGVSSKYEITKLTIEAIYAVNSGSSLKVLNMLPIKIIIHAKILPIPQVGVHDMQLRNLCGM